MRRFYRALYSSWFLVGVVVFCIPDYGPVHAQEITADLTELSIEELMNIEVTSVSKRAQKFTETSAAVFVITHEDIRRSGVTSIADALRMAPGVQVGRVDANKWAISIRGFNSLYANKLLVLIDGRSVYTPLDAGVDWDEQDTLLEDIDRIEVIRGPGGALWGANAVNGVINIITKSAKDTQGLMATGGYGSLERGFGAIRWGGRAGDDFYYRLYTKFFDREGVIKSPAGSVERRSSEWESLRGGGRVDWDVTGSDLLTLVGEIYRGEARENFRIRSLTAPYSFTEEDDTDSTGGFALGRWTHRLSESSETQLQVYYTKTERYDPIEDTTLQVFDVDFQHTFHLGDRHEFVWGLGYRHTKDQIESKTFTVSYSPEKSETPLYSFFVQDEVTMLEDRLRLTLGSKFEHNEYTGLEVQPTGRILWAPAERHTLWAAVSRAVRIPARSDRDLTVNTTVIPGATPTVLTLKGDPNLSTSEVIVAYELGYRVRPVERVFLDAAAFYNVLDPIVEYPNDFSSPTLETTPAPAHLVSTKVRRSGFDGVIYGAELAADWAVKDWWELKAAFTYLHMDLNKEIENEEGRNVRRQVSIRSMMDLSESVELDLWGRYQGEVPAWNVPSYVTLDARLGWEPREGLELSLVGQNLLDNAHPEARNEGTASALPHEMRRSVYGKLTWRF